MRSMARLCEMCMKTFHVNDEQLQEFLHSFDEEQKQTLLSETSGNTVQRRPKMKIKIAECVDNDTANDSSDEEPACKLSKIDSSPPASDDQECCSFSLSGSRHTQDKINPSFGSHDQEFSPINSLIPVSSRDEEYCPIHTKSYNQEFRHRSSFSSGSHDQACSPPPISSSSTKSHDQACSLPPRSSSSRSHDQTCSPPPRNSSSTRSHDQECCPKVRCVACLGLLEQQYIQHLAHVITEQVTEMSMVGMETYSLSIHVPVSVPIRRIGMETFAKRTTNSQTELSGYVSENHYAKEELRFQLRKHLVTSLSPLKCTHESPLTIILKLDHKSSLRDCIGLKKLRPKIFPRPKKHRNSRHNQPQVPTPITSLPVQKALQDLTEADLVKEGFFLSPITSPCNHTVELLHRSIFVAGRYNKYSRTLPQTPWFVDGVRKAETSVQELLSPRIIKAFRATDARFSSSGREDVDVLMLGKGRPFLLELINPKDVSVDSEVLQKIEDDINGETKLIAVRQLKRVGKESSNILKQGEKEKVKTYSALVWTDKEISKENLKLLDESKNILLKQRTPIRVLHRRTLAVREKLVYSMETNLIDPHHFQLKLVTQAGTYIKEFVHGDFGRTQPNISTMLECDADILSLDVLDVQLQWPPGS